MPDAYAVIPNVATPQWQGMPEDYEYEVERSGVTYFKTKDWEKAYKLRIQQLKLQKKELEPYKDSLLYAKAGLDLIHCQQAFRDRKQLERKESNMKELIHDLAITLCGIIAIGFGTYVSLYFSLIGGSMISMAGGFTAGQGLSCIIMYDIKGNR